MNAFVKRVAIAAAATLFVMLSAAAFAQTSPAAPAQRGAAAPHSDGRTSTAAADKEHEHHHMMHMQHHANGVGDGELGMPGQDAFGTIAEVVRQLDADPKTDWSKVNLEALRQHLIDMNEVTLKADASAKPVDGGLAITVTGSGRTLAAIRRMVPAHAREINGKSGWIAKTTELPNGELLTVTASEPKEVQHIRGLGFIGILVSGAHHQAHHLAIAKGEMGHAH
jgi:hypothetical protein